jgi:hypothetical protein
MKTWHAFAFLIVTAVIYYYAGKLILIIAALYLLLRAWLWLCRRYPLVAWGVLGFCRGLFGRR